MDPNIAFLVWLLVALVVIFILILIAKQVVSLLGLTAEQSRIVYLILGLILFLWLIGTLTGYAPPYWRRP